jgi:glycosyltransferase involved in cell wall biosynthesis
MADDELKALLLSGRFEVRGTCLYTIGLAEHLHKHSVSPLIISPDISLVQSNEHHRYLIEEYRYLGFPIWGRVSVQLLAKELRESPPDIIHIQSRKALSYGTRLSKILNCPYILTVHDYLQSRERLKIEPHLCKKVIAVSDSVKRGLLETTPLSSEMITVIPNGVELPDQKTSRSVLTPNQIPVIGTAGPLEKSKGFPYFLGAAQQVLSKNRDVEFLISGAGPEERNLRRLSSQLGISDRITFLPNLDDFTKSIQAMDLFCLPSLEQGQGTMMLIAMSLGKPVIATNVGGPSKIINDNETGLSVPPADSHQLAERMLELLNDPVRARAIGEAGRKLIQEQFEQQVMLEKTVELYRNCVTQHCRQSEPVESKL